MILLTVAMLSTALAADPGAPETAAPVTDSADTVADDAPSDASAPAPADVQTAAQRTNGSLLALLKAQIRDEVLAELARPNRASATLSLHHRPDRTDDTATSGERTYVKANATVDDAVGFGVPVVVAGEVLGSATSFGRGVVVRDGGVVHGDAVSFGGRVRVEPGGVVQGSQLSWGNDHASAVDPGPSWLSALTHRLIGMLSFAGAGVILVGLFPDRVSRVAARLSERPVGSLVIGTAATGVLAVAAVLFAATVIGLPVSFLLVALLGLAWLLGFVGVCQALGDRLPVEQRVHGRWLAFLGGTLIVAFIGSLPIFGVLAAATASVIGVGAALSSRLGTT